MAWIETCKIDARKQIKHLSKQGMSTRQAIKKLAHESGIPENTINNWVYERTASKRIDVFNFFLDTMRDDLIADGFPTEKVQLFFADRKIIVLWAMRWMLLEEKYIRGWYLAAFEKYGRAAKITDMMRTANVWCNCPNCYGKVRQMGKPHESLNPALFTRSGYVNFNAIRETEV